MEHRVSCPLLPEPSRLQTLEQVFLPGEVVVERGGKQRFPEPPRPAQEHIIVRIRQFMHISRFVNVQIAPFYDLVESLHPDRVPYPFCLHSANLFYVLPSKIMNIPGFPIIFGNG